MGAGGGVVTGTVTGAVTNWLSQRVGTAAAGFIVVTVEKTSSGSSVCLKMKVRVAAEKKVGRRARRIEELLHKS
jgi:hypothetical protein